MDFEKGINRVLGRDRWGFKRDWMGVLRRRYMKFWEGDGWGFGEGIDEILGRNGWDFGKGMDGILKGDGWDSGKEINEIFGKG